ncbi:hypothetical protein PIB30_067025 [Stylosanthes scabra]|uniref:Uncharacterized protein n=1 Tax=Stylosanthes scabra TaxID=79078 RepID=A0ABU6ZL94_9FABA|nr:hypothetical protein [Stylosanthes scabra]
MLAAESAPEGVEVPPSPEEVNNLRRNKHKLCNEDGVETAPTSKKPTEAPEEGHGATPPRRSYVSMVKGLDYVYELSSDSEGEEESSDTEVDSNYEFEFEYSNIDGEVKGSVNWKARRMIPRRRVVKGEDDCLNLVMNKAKEGTITLINVGNDFFLTRFSHIEDYERALKEGPHLRSLPGSSEMEDRLQPSDREA